MITLKRNPFVPFGIFAIIATFYIVGCLAPTIRSVGSESYRDVRINPVIIAEGQVAILPTTSVAGIAVDVAGGVEGLRRSVNDNIQSAFALQFPEVYFLNARETLGKISATGMTEEYSDLLATYERTAILNADVLRRLGTSIESRFLLHTKITGYRNWRESNNNHSSLAVLAQLWDTQEGDIVWEGNGDARGMQAWMHTPLELDDLAKEACSAMMLKMR